MTTRFSYDGLGRRVRKSSGSAASTVLFAYDQNDQLLGEYDARGNAIREYVWLGATPVAMVAPDASAATQIYAIHTDHLGAPRVLVDANGKTRWTWPAEPFGTTAPDTNPSSLGTIAMPLRMPAQYADPESGLSYNVNRDYDPSTGRYVQSDPIGLAGGVNTYAYVNGNPVGDVDPTGEFGLVGGLVGGLGDLGYQLYKNGGNFKCVNWWEVGSWALTGSGAGIVGRAGLTGIANFFSNANKFKNISRAHWGARGGANGMSLDHWMISRAAGRSGAVSESIVNGGWNLLEIPRTWNTWLGFAPAWGGTDAALAAAARLGIQFGVPGVAAASGYAGYQIGTNAQQEQCGCK